MKSYRDSLLGKCKFGLISISMAMSVGAWSVAYAQAQSPSPLPVTQAVVQPADALFTAAEIEKLVAPIALFPDALLAQVLPASAYPIDIVQAQRWLSKNKAAVQKQDFTGLDAQSWDPTVKAIARFPSIIQMMNDDLDWVTDLGDAFVNQPKDVAEAIQRLRAKAATSGALRTTSQQKVVNRTENTQSIIVIESADPEVIFVPTYDPVQVFYPGTGVVASSLLTFGAGVAIGAVWNNNFWNWGSGAVYPPRWPGYPGYRPGLGGNNNNINIGNDINIGNNVRPWRPDGDRYRPGQGSKPGLRPENRPGNRPGVRPVDGPNGRPGLDRPGAGADNRPGLDRPGPGAGNISRPDRPGAQPGPRPGAQPGQRPGAQPGQRPGADRPNAGVNRPAANPAPRPVARPSQSAPSSAFAGANAGRVPAQAFSNRGAQSINNRPAVGGGRPSAGARPGGGPQPGGGGRVGGRR